MRAGSTTSLVFDGQGNLIESWTQWDAMMQRPHFVAISPYDPQKHVWILDDHKHAIFKMTHDGKQIVQTIGTYGVPGNDDKHFNRPTFLDWFPDGSFVVADGYNGTRVVKFDKDGKLRESVGPARRERQGDAPGLLQQRARHRDRPEDATASSSNDRGNHRVQVFDRDGKFLDQWSFGPNPSDVHLFHIFSDGACGPSIAAPARC